MKGYSTELVKEDAIVAMVTDRFKERSERIPERVGDYFTSDLSESTYVQNNLHQHRFRHSRVSIRPAFGIR